MLRYFFFDGNPLPAPTAMIRREVFDKVGLFDPRLLQTQDFDLWVRVVLYYEIHVIPEPLVAYRIRNDGGNADANTPTKLARIEWEIQKVLERFCAMSDPELFFRAFPEVSQYAQVGLPLQALLAIAALGGPQRWTRAFGLDLLYRQLADPAVVESLDAVGYSYPRFFALVADVDPLATNALRETTNAWREATNALGELTNHWHKAVDYLQKVEEARDYFKVQAEYWERKSRTVSGGSGKSSVE